MDTTLKLYLPFDEVSEVNEAVVTADFSKYRHDATITGDAELKAGGAVLGQALVLNGGEAVTDYELPWSQNFTLVCWVKPTQNMVGWLLNFTGSGNYFEQLFDVVPGEWHSFIFVRNGNTFTVYMDRRAVYVGEMSANPIGLAVSEPGLFESNASVDEVMVYERALTAEEIIKIKKGMDDVEYYVDGVNFKQFGVYVSESTGLVGQLKRKEGLTVEWPDYHGKVVDRQNPRYEERKISLTCFIEAESRQDYVQKANAFFEAFRASGTQRLKVEFDGTTRPLVYEVYMKDSADTSKKWGQYNSDLMVGTFKLVLEEDEPVKRVVRFTGPRPATIAYTSPKLTNIYWGDGTHTFNLSGEVSQSHTYAEEGTYDIIVTGVIENITGFTTNGIVIWNKLQ